MKIFYNQNYCTDEVIEADLQSPSLKDSIEKTRLALEIAYAGFDNAVDADMIDSYIYEINSLQMRYKHLIDLAAADPLPETEKLRAHSPIRALVSHVFG